MAYVERWFTSWEPLGQSYEYTLRIKEDGYGGGTTAIDILAKEPMTIRTRGNNEKTIGAIIGTELEFSFWVLPADGTDYDDLFTASNRQFLIEVERDSVLFFVGYMKPENNSRPLIHNRFMVTLSAACGLGDLKNFKYGSYSGKASFLEHIKRALTETGHTLEIHVVLNTYEDTLMTINDCALKDADINSERFYKVEDGIYKPELANFVLTQCIGLFNCSIKQVDGAWYIFNNVEGSSKKFIYDWATLTQQSFLSINTELAIDAYNFRNKGELSYRPPLSEVGITFQNKYVGTTLLTNGDFSGGTTGWSNGSSPNDWDSFSVISSQLRVQEYTTLDDDRNVVSDSFSVVETDPTNQIKISLKGIVTHIVYAVGELGVDEMPWLLVIVTNTGTSETRTVNFGQMSESWTEYENTAEMLTMGTGNYTFTIQIQGTLLIDELDVYFDDVVCYIEYGDSAQTTDKLVTIKNVAAVDELVQTYMTKVGDSAELNNQGSITIGGVLTEAWNTYTRTERVEIIDLLGAFQLNARQSFTRYLRLQISDPSDTIRADSVLTFDGNLYRMIRFKKTFKKLTVDVDLFEINTA